MFIIHRPGNLATLPFFSDAKQRLEDNETPYMDIIKTLQSCDLDIEWEIECLPIILPKRKWFSMLREKFPPQMEILSDYEILSGVRELSEGILKYEGSYVEFMDRLLFITVSKSEMKEGMSKIVRHGQNPTSYPDLRNLRLSMEVTPEIRPRRNIHSKNINVVEVVEYQFAKMWRLSASIENIRKVATDKSLLKNSLQFNRSIHHKFLTCSASGKVMSVSTAMASKRLNPFTMEWGAEAAVGYPMDKDTAATFLTP
ncbi:hypothetical protein KUTeg_000739 [Tegillarca granosa]|uniref:Uncharacterized protein n=1 Tax=Tegillarca granosa TaxID=220873 RepID=A0ABQ9FYD7_TEGGR|nr:hypothetical protein KUTeg_000739 [Tegillarca granosa]